MSAEVSTSNWIDEETAFKLAAILSQSAPREASRNLPITVAAELEDVLAMLRTAVLLARHFGVPLFVVLPDADSGRAICPSSPLEMRLGSAPCSAMLAGLLHSTERRLRAIFAKSQENFSVEIGFLAEPRGIFLRIK